MNFKQLLEKISKFDHNIGFTAVIDRYGMVKEKIQRDGTSSMMDEYEQKCQEMVDDPEVRFAGLLDESGVLLAGGYKQGITPRLTEDQHQIICKELASRGPKRKKFDAELGHVKFSASRREHLLIMSFPIYEKVLLIIAEPNVNIDRLSLRIVTKLGKQWDDFGG